MKLYYYFLCCLIPLHVQSQNLDEKWEITPLKKVNPGKGRLDLRFPGDVEWSVDVYNSSNKFITNRSIKDQRNVEDKKDYYELPAGIYKLKLNTVVVENVPIQEGKLTRIKAGTLDVKNSGRWELRNESGKNFLTSGNTQKKLALPVGRYQLGAVKNFEVVQITDLVENGNSIPGIDPDVPLSPLYEITESPENGENGELEIITFPLSALAIEIEPGEIIENPDWDPSNLEFTLIVMKSQYDTVVKTKRTSIELPPGNYKVNINNSYVRGPVSIVKGKTTRIKAGFLKVTEDKIDRAFKISAGYSNTGWVIGWFFQYDKIIVLPVLSEGTTYRLSKYKLKGKHSDEKIKYDLIYDYDVDMKDRQMIINGKKTGEREQLGKGFY